MGHCRHGDMILGLKGSRWTIRDGGGRGRDYRKVENHVYMSTPPAADAATLRPPGGRGNFFLAGPQGEAGAAPPPPTPPVAPCGGAWVPRPCARAALRRGWRGDHTTGWPAMPCTRAALRPASWWQGGRDPGGGVTARPRGNSCRSAPPPLDGIERPPRRSRPRLFPVFAGVGPRWYGCEPAVAASTIGRLQRVP